MSFPHLAWQPTRREAVASGLAGGLLLAWGSRHIPHMPTRPIETDKGKIRGLHRHGVTVFRGIPYGADTAQHRYQPAPPAPSWADVRKCFANGPLAPQAGAAGPQSENCLVLNVFTPQASAAHKRPVMVWLHGGWFTNGSGGDPLFDGSALCHGGDVVVVSINHRLGALGYLYLAGLDKAFVDSGNLGQLDIILALQWVRDNIAAFGGDPGNVTIFGESGGGLKISTLLCMPAAQGLFHKAIIQSAPTLDMPSIDQANATAEQILAKLGIPKSNLHRLLSMDFHTITAAAAAAFPLSALAPVVDGRNLPANPFTPVAPAMSRNIPLIIGTNHDEATLSLWGDAGFWSLTAAQARARFAEELPGGGAEAALALYKAQCPGEPPCYWVMALLTDKTFRMSAIAWAERKAAQQAAPVFMYRLDWRTPVLGGLLLTPHGLDVPLVFNNVEAARGMVGPGPAPQRMADIMSRAWTNFARTGNPGPNWPAYGETTRDTMIFNLPSQIIPDPDQTARLFWRDGG